MFEKVITLVIPTKVFVFNDGHFEKRYIYNEEINIFKLTFCSLQQQRCNSKMMT